MTMRTKTGEEKYQRAIRNNKLTKLYNEKVIKDFTFWMIVENRFPHNKIAKVNHMLVLKRECDGLSFIRFEEWFELEGIMAKIKHNYDNLVFNFPSMSSIKTVPHAHLYKLKKEFK